MLTYKIGSQLDVTLRHLNLTVEQWLGKLGIRPTPDGVINLDEGFINRALRLGVPLPAFLMAKIIPKNLTYSSGYFSITYITGSPVFVKTVDHGYTYYFIDKLPDGKISVS